VMLLQTEPLKLYYVMYKSSKPSSAKTSSNLGIVNCNKFCQPRRKHSDVVHKNVDEECTEWSTEVCGQPADNDDVSVNTSDTAVVGSRAKVLTKPDFETCNAEFQLLSSEEAIAVSVDADVRPLGPAGYTASFETLSTVVSALETRPDEVDSKPTSDVVESPPNMASDSIILQDAVGASSEFTGQEKIGFEADAITSNDQWPHRLPAMERRVKRLQKEVRRLLLDESQHAKKPELRASGRVLGGMRRKTRRSPLLRLRSIVSIRSSTSGRSSDRFSGRVDLRRN